MKHRIRRIDPLSTAKIAGILYGMMGVLFAPIFLLASFASPEGASFGIGFTIAIPFLYAALGFIFTGIGAALYNLVSGWIGGIEMDLDTSPSA